MVPPENEMLQNRVIPGSSLITMGNFTFSTKATKTKSFFTNV